MRARPAWQEDRGSSNVNSTHMARDCNWFESLSSFAELGRITPLSQSRTAGAETALPVFPRSLFGGSAMQVTEIALDHVIGLDGHDRGPAMIKIGPSGDILEINADTMHE